MGALTQALGGSRTLIATLALLLASVLAATLSAGDPATGAEPDPIDVPMTGNLPACPAQMYAFGPSDVWVNGIVFRNQFSEAAEIGLKNNCAMQNWQDPDNTSSFPRAVDAKAVPDTISISSEPVTVSIQASSLAAPGPYNTIAPNCMPRSTRPGGCANPIWDYYFVGYRLANGAGEFVGKWTLAGVDEPNPYFDMTRGSCPDNYPAWSENYEHIGIPCIWTLRFVTTAHGAPVLNNAMQVVLATPLRAGTYTQNGITGPMYDFLAVVPMLFQPGASTALDLRTSASSARSGTTFKLTAVAQGPAPGTPVNFYRRPAVGGWSYLGQVPTNASNQATLPVQVSTTGTYRARLVSGGTETTTSPERTVVATRLVTLKAEQLSGNLVRFIGKVKPADNAGKAMLQTLTERGWKTMERGAIKRGKATWEVQVPKGKSSWRLVTKSTPEYGKSVSRRRSVNPAN